MMIPPIMLSIAIIVTPVGRLTVLAVIGHARINP
jgi:hypothetical protein